MKCKVLISFERFVVGQEIERPDPIVKVWQRRGLVEIVEDKPVEMAVASDESETATLRGRRGRRS